MIKNFMEIQKISDEYNAPDIQGNLLTHTSEAFKHFIRGYDAFKYIELESAVDWYSKAIAADSSFIYAYVMSAYANLMNGNNFAARKCVDPVMARNKGLPVEETLMLGQLNAYFNETPYEEIRYTKQLIDIDEGLQLTEKILALYPEHWPSLDTKGWALYKQGKYEEVISFLKEAWEHKTVYSHTVYLHIREVEKALAYQNGEL